MTSAMIQGPFNHDLPFPDDVFVNGLCEPVCFNYQDHSLELGPIWAQSMSMQGF